MKQKTIKDVLKLTSTLDMEVFNVAEEFKGFRRRLMKALSLLSAAITSFSFSLVSLFLSYISFESEHYVLGNVGFILFILLLIMSVIFIMAFAGAIPILERMYKR